MNELLAGSRNNEKFGRMAFVLHAISDEIADELNSYEDNGQLEIYWQWVSHMLSWIGTGDTDALPEPLKPFARRILGIPEPEGQKELTA